MIRFSVRFRVSNSYVLGLVFLRSGVSVRTFWG